MSSEVPLRLVSTFHEHEISALRLARTDDVPAIAALLRRAYPDDPTLDMAEVGRLVNRGWMLLVTDDDDQVVGAVHVELDGKYGHVSMLTMDPLARSHDLARRLLGVADVLCAAHGCAPQEHLH